METHAVTRTTRIVAAETLAEAVLTGLRATPKTLPSKYLYDDVGSQLFEAICYLPEYYLTRTEREILDASSEAIVARLDPGCRLVELGAGSAVKTRIIIRAMLQRHAPLVYCPIDISEEAMRIAQANIVSEFPGCRFKGVIGDWMGSLERLSQMDSTQKLVLFLGSSIGNLDEDEAIGFLTALRERIGPRDRLLIGTDMAKPAEELVPAYDDAAGVTAAFNKNLLVRINHELGGDFDTQRFRHEARWDAGRGRIEMHLVSTMDQTVHVEALDLDVPFAEGESIHTENSHKYTQDQVAEMFRRAGLRIEETWTDPQERFALHLVGLS